MTPDLEAYGLADSADVEIEQMVSTLNASLAPAAPKKGMKIKLPVKKPNKIEPGNPALLIDGNLHCAGCKQPFDEGVENVEFTQTGAFSVEIKCSHCGCVSTHNQI